MFARALSPQLRALPAPAPAGDKSPGPGWHCRAGVSPQDSWQLSRVGTCPEGPRRAVLHMLGCPSSAAGMEPPRPQLRLIPAPLDRGKGAGGSAGSTPQSWLGRESGQVWA